MFEYFLLDLKTILNIFAFHHFTIYGELNIKGILVLRSEDPYQNDLNQTTSRFDLLNKFSRGEHQC